jgi:GNAT superfamily N-acetyltransferase
VSGKEEVVEETTKVVKVLCRDVDGSELGRASLVLVRNGLHDRPYGLLEDVFVREDRRGQGLGHRLVERVIGAARAEGCYKLIATSRYSRPRVHQLYAGFGFADHGKEFRMELV